MSVNINSLKIGTAIRFREGSLIDEGEVAAINYDDNEIVMKSFAADGTPSELVLDIDEPGLEVAA